MTKAPDVSTDNVFVLFVGVTTTDTASKPSLWTVPNQNTTTDHDLTLPRDLTYQTDPKDVDVISCPRKVTVRQNYYRLFL